MQVPDHRRTEATARPPVFAPLLTIEDVAARLNVSVRHVRRLVCERRIPYVKWGRLLRFEADEIERWLRQARRDAEFRAYS